MIEQIVNYNKVMKTIQKLKILKLKIQYLKCKIH